jgi:hypothetical protein
LGIAPVGINTNPAGTETDGFSLIVEPNHEPAERIGTDIKA